MSETAKVKGPTDFRDPHLEHRRAQERAHLEAVGQSSDPMASLVTVELNITELCNRTCVFCPRVDPELYPNRNLNMTVALAEKIAADLAAIGSKCRISFSGFGEPLLHKGFHEIIRTFRARLPENTIEVNTNGDRLTAGKIRELFGAGLTYLYVNMYDGPEQRAGFERLFADAGLEPSQWRLRPHWPDVSGNFGLTLNNRSGLVSAPEIELGALKQALQMRCHYPFYKMLVDWNGDVLFCSNDWGREIIVGNVLESSISDIWLSEKMYQVRRHLMKGERCFSPCNKCDVHGTLHGKPSFDRLVQHYVDEGKLGADDVPD